jgi:LacI family transcriptional regulator
MSKARHHLVFIGKLGVHSVREVCLGAAEYAAGRPDLDFDPWPSSSGVESGARRDDVLEADCVIAPDTDICRLFGNARHLKMPYVNVLDHRPKLASVELDDAAIGRMAADHLLSRGYRNLAFVGSTEWPWSGLRKASFTHAVKPAGIVPKSYEFAADVLPIEWAWKSERRRRRLAEVLTALPKPCGVFAANDVIACFLIETARDLGIRIPEQIGVLGVDDDPVPNAAAGLAISSVVVPFREMGRRAAEMVDRLRHGKEAQRIQLPPTRVVVRTSTDAFMVEDTLVRRAQAFIESHRSGRIKVADVAHAVGCTRVTLGQRFGRHLGMGVLDYILQRRMEYAKDLLRMGDLNVDEVAQDCGFRSTPFFCSVFKRITGTTPGKVRAEGRGMK